MKKKLVLLIIIIAILLVIATIFLFSNNKLEYVKYGDFCTSVSNGEVKKVIIIDDKLHVYF